MVSTNPGDIVVGTFLVVSPRTGVWNMAACFLSGSILETIFSPGIQAEFEIIDTEDYLNRMDLRGDEAVIIQFTKVNGGTGSYTFHLNNVKFVELKGAMKSKVYKLICISREALSGQGNSVQKAYNTQISGIVQDLFGMLGSTMSLSTEETKGKRNIKIANQSIYEAIEMLRQEAVSPSNQSSNFMFFASQSGFSFKTIENMAQGGSVRTFKQSDAVGYSIFSDVDSNIIAWQVLQNFDAMNRLVAGAMNQRVSTFNPHTNEYNKKDVKDSSAAFSMGSGAMITDAFKQIFGDANRAIFRLVNPNKNLNIDKSNLPDAIPHKMSNLAQMSEQLLRMTVIGDPSLEAGKVVTCNVPEIVSTTGTKGPEQQVSGNWLISKLEHLIRRPGETPRYLCNVEGLKGAYAGG